MSVFPCAVVEASGGLSRASSCADRVRCRERVQAAPAADRSARARASGRCGVGPPGHGDDHRDARFQAMELETEIGAELVLQARPRRRDADAFLQRRQRSFRQPDAVVANLDPELVVLPPGA